MLCIPKRTDRQTEGWTTDKRWSHRHSLSLQLKGWAKNDPNMHEISNGTLCREPLVNSECLYVYSQRRYIETNYEVYIIYCHITNKHVYIFTNIRSTWIHSPTRSEIFYEIVLDSMKMSISCLSCCSLRSVVDTVPSLYTFHTSDPFSNLDQM